MAMKALSPNYWTNKGFPLYFMFLFMKVSLPFLLSAHPQSLEHMRKYFLSVKTLKKKIILLFFSENLLLPVHSGRIIFAVYVFVVQLLSHVQLCNPTDCSTPGSPVLHCLLEFAQFMSTESVMLSNHLLLCPTSPFAFNLSQHQGVFQQVGSSHQVAKVLGL